MRTETHQIKKKVLPNGTIVIDDLPFEAEAGDVVTIILTKGHATDQKELYPFQGISYTFSDPLGSAVPAGEWDALK